MFDPQLGKSIKINQELFDFVEHPGTSGIKTAFAAEGRKAVVYKLKCKGTENYFALKVFKNKFQSSNLIENSMTLANLGDIEGMKVCKRRCITFQNNPELVKAFPDLNYSLLMPWIEGRTWFDIVTLKSKIVSVENSIKLAQKVTSILANLEARGYAHCDISSGNIIIGCDINPNNEVVVHDNLWIELIDVEDMYGKDFPKPSACPKGTDGYNHPSRNILPDGQWCEEGDRFSGAVLISELLCWFDPSFRQQAYCDSSYFAKSEMKKPSSRYSYMFSILNGIGEPLGDCLKAAWRSSDLSQCPKILDWQQALISSINSIEQIRRKLNRAIKSGFVQEIILLSNELRKNNQSLSETEWRAYSHARQQITSQENLERAIQNKNEIEILSAYGKVIHEPVNPKIKSQVDSARQILERWVRLKRALDENDDAEICKLYDSIIFGQSTLISQDDQEKINQALTRQNLVAVLRSVFATHDPLRILGAYPENLLKNSSLLTYEDQQAIKNARLALAKTTSLGKQSIHSKSTSSLPSNEQEIIDLWLRGLVNNDLLESDADRQRLAEVIQRLGRDARTQYAIQKSNIKSQASV